MPLPAPLVGLTIRAKVIAADSTAMVGATVTLTPTVPARSPAGDVLVAAVSLPQVTASDGTAAWANVLATDSPGLSNRVPYKVTTVDSAGRILEEPYVIELLASQAVAGVLRLDDVVRATPPTPYASYLLTAGMGATGGAAGPLDGSGKIPGAQIPATGGVPDATTTSKGVIQLAGDLAGTATTPTVPGLASKQPLDSDLTAIAALAPADGALIQRVAGAWNAQSTGQVKTSLGITATDVDLGNVANLAPADLPVSTATQAALDGKAPRSHITDSQAVKYGIVAASGRFAEFQGTGGFANQMVIAAVVIPAGVSFSRMVLPIKSTGTFTPGSGKPNCLMWWNTAGQFQQQTPDDNHMWEVADWYVANLPSTTAAQSTDRLVFAGMQISGYSGGGQFVLTQASDTGGIPFSHAPGSSVRFGMYASAVSAFADINPTSFGTMTSFVPFIGFLP